MCAACGFQEYGTSDSDGDVIVVVGEEGEEEMYNTPENNYRVIHYTLLCKVNKLSY